MAGPRNPRIIIVGAGVAGIATAHTLLKHGFNNLTILEKGAAVGGVWHWNRYPGLTCDVPSNLYQFSFAPKPDWARIFATGPEINQYLNAVVDECGLRHRVQLNAEVVSAIYDSGQWSVTLEDGKALTAEFLIMATGLLHHPYIPDIEGLEDFEGPVVHSASWDETLQTEGRRIGVVGSGSTGVQLVSALQPTAYQLVHFNRSPQWILWSPMNLRQPRLMSTLLRRSPSARSWLYGRLLRQSAILAEITTRPGWRRTLVQQYARLCLRLQVRDRRLRTSLTPNDEPLCKRQVVSGSYYRAISEPNTTLVTELIERVTPTGIEAADGAHYDLDIIILATGFQAHNYMRPMAITGRGGVTLDEVWRQGPRAYRMTAIPGFPNLFTILGPNSPTGSISLQYTSEVTAEYVARWLRRYCDREFDTIEVTEEATERFNRAAAAALEPTVWSTGCKSWYLTDRGDVDLWPYDRGTLAGMLSAPELDDYHLEPSAT